MGVVLEGATRGAALGCVIGAISSCTIYADEAATGAKHLGKCTSLGGAVGFIGGGVMTIREYYDVYAPVPYYTGDYMMLPRHLDM